MKKIVTKKLFLLVFIIAFSVLFLEAALRIFFGFGTLPVFVEDSDYEYIYAPDQDIHRLGRHFFTNHFSMRNDALSTNDSLRILIFGDSILNGGAQNDNDDLATSILEKNLSSNLKKKVRALNISAMGWGPDNAASYLKKHGDFGEKMIVLVFSSHDYYDNMGFEKVVGISSEYPAKNPSSAIADFLFRVLIPVVKYSVFPNDNERQKSMYDLHSQKMNTGWNSFVEYAHQNHIPLLVYLHGERDEVIKGYYNQYGKQLIEYLAAAHIPYVLDVNLKPDLKLYRDFTHFNEGGQKFMAKALEPLILKTFLIQHH